MTHPPLLCAALLIVAARAWADDGGFSTKSFGEGGGYKHPDSATQQYLDGAAHPAADASAAPATASPVAASAAPAAAAPVIRAPLAFSPARVPSAPRPRPRDAASSRGAAPAAEGAPTVPRRESLWNGSIQPLDVGAIESADEAHEGAERDYESRILGQAPRPERSRLGAPADGAPVPSSTPESAGRVFVSLEIDPREAGTLRDAVADLGASSGFFADSRFEPRGAVGGGALVSGWLPAGRLGDVLTRHGVRSVRVETRPRPSDVRQTTGDFLVGLRVDDPARARDVVAQELRVLSARVSFRPLRVVGLETAPGGRAVAVIAGRLPLSQLRQALDMPEVVKISPVDGPIIAPGAAARAAAGPSWPRFTRDEGLWLALLTLLLALPSLRDPLKRLAGVLSPYR